MHIAWRGEPQLVQEAALVPAFEALAAELRAHAAPPELAGARRAMVDELRHAARVALASIARDEAGHALLSFAIDDWARSRLGARASRALEEARREALQAAVQPSA